MWQTGKRRGKVQSVGWPTLGSALGLISALCFLTILALTSCGLTQVSGEAKGPAMAQYTPSSDTSELRYAAPAIPLGLRCRQSPDHEEDILLVKRQRNL